MYVSISFFFYLIDGSITADISNCLKKSELFAGDTSKENHLPAPVIRGAIP